jgi:hypothetical protein
MFAALTLSAQLLPETQILPDPIRDPWQRPDQVISALKFTAAETVAVIENGFPYFAQRIAPHVGKVYAVNTDPRAFQGRGVLPPEITTIIASNLDPAIAGLHLDTVIMVDVLPFLEQRGPFYAGLAAGLKRGGRAVIIDRNLPSTIPPPRNIPPSQVLDEVTAGPFTLSANLNILPYQYFLIFTF